LLPHTAECYSICFGICISNFHKAILQFSLNSIKSPQVSAVSIALTEGRNHSMHTCVCLGSGYDDGAQEGHSQSYGPCGPQPHPLPAHNQHPCMGGGLQQWQVD